MELDRIRNLHCNKERVVFPQTVVLQRVSLMSGLRNILDLIESCLELRNKGTYNKLVQDSYRAVE